MPAADFATEKLKIAVLRHSGSAFTCFSGAGKKLITGEVVY